MPQVMIANRLTDGLVVFLDGNGAWVERISEAQLVETEDEGARLTEIAAKAVAKPEVVDPYLIDVRLEGDTITPTRRREEIRALGPTNRTDLGKQAEK